MIFLLLDISLLVGSVLAWFLSRFWPLFLDLLEVFWVIIKRSKRLFRAACLSVSESVFCKWSPFSEAACLSVSESVMHFLGKKHYSLYIQRLKDPRVQQAEGHKDPSSNKCLLICWKCSGNISIKMLTYISWFVGSGLVALLDSSAKSHHSCSNKNRGAICI